jgi:hypothetical protein
MDKCGGLPTRRYAGGDVKQFLAGENIPVRLRNENVLNESWCQIDVASNGS